MDPLSALSVAAAVVQFADFGYTLIKNTHELYKSTSGRSAKSIELSTVSSDLVSLADGVKTQLDSCRDGPQGPGEDIFVRLCRECEGTNEELQQILVKVSAGGKESKKVRVTWAAASLAAAIRGAVAAGDIERLAEKLVQTRQQMMVALLSLFMGEAHKIRLELVDFAKQQDGIVTALSQIDHTTREFSARLVHLVDQSSSEDGLIAEEMIHYVMSEKWKPDEAWAHVHAKSDRDWPFIRGIQQTLFFGPMGNRETTIPTKYSSTFEWIFREPRASDKGQPMWSDFPRWLKGNSTDIYWMTGKPGAGKSTMIKFVANDSRLKALLEPWAGDSKLLMASFFAWTAGMDKLQKTQEGLMRTLLMEIIQQVPDSVEFVARLFPARWFLYQTFQGGVRIPGPTKHELESALRLLVTDAGHQIKLFFIIDGLDEFEDDHQSLVKLLHSLSQSTSVKICTSSRPWNVFSDEYRRNPMLRLENLTHEDIQLFIIKRLEPSTGYQDFAIANPQEARKIVRDITNKAQGVFLWVAVVLGLLEESFQEGARISDMQNIIDKLPSEVSDLFCYIWDRTSKSFRREASQYFQIMQYCKHSAANTLYGITLWFVDQDVSKDFVPANLNVRAALNIVERRLMSRTGGLLELVRPHVYQEDVPRLDFHDNPKSSIPYVDFMHRTANDWVQENWESIVSSTDHEYDTLFWHSKGEIMRIILDQPLATTFWNGPIKSILYGLAGVENSPTKQAVLFDVLNQPSKFIANIRSDELDGDWPSACGDFNHPGLLTVNWDDPAPFTHNELKAGDGAIQPARLQLYRDISKECKYDFRIEECYSFLELVLRVPIIPYVKQVAQISPDFFTATSAATQFMKGIVFGELWFPRALLRLELLEFILKNRPWDNSSLAIGRSIVEDAKILDTVMMARRSMFIFSAPKPRDMKFGAFLTRVEMLIKRYQAYNEDGNAYFQESKSPDEGPQDEDEGPLSRNEQPGRSTEGGRYGSKRETLRSFFRWVRR